MYALHHHPNFTTERWRKYPWDQQILMIANEVNRIKNGIHSHQPLAILKEAFERAFELVDLTVDCHLGARQYELLRWRELFSGFYLVSEQEIQQQKTELERILRVLLQMSGPSAQLLTF